MVGYWKDPEATAASIRGGLLYTGDIGRLDAAGYLHLVDRRKDLIISGGSNIYPREVEDVLLQHWAIAAVAVVGLPHREWGETVHAAVVLRPGAAASARELIEFCRVRIASPQPSYAETSRRSVMAAIGIDTHKRTLAACAVDAVGSVIDEQTFSCDQAGFVELAAWAGDVAPEGRIGIEGSASYGAPVAHPLMAAGFTVREVPPQLSRRERGRSRRPGKSDPGDALAIARVTLREPELPPVRLEDRSTELGLLADARDDLVHAQTRARNRLHAHLVVLLPGYGRKVAQLVSGRQLAVIEGALTASLAFVPSSLVGSWPRSGIWAAAPPRSSDR